METIDKIIAMNIVAQMDHLKMDQGKLAQKTGLSRQTINRILGGKQGSIRPSNLEKIAEALGTTRLELETRHSSSEISNSTKSAMIGELNMILTTLDEPQIAQILRLAKVHAEGVAASSPLVDEKSRNKA